MNLTPNEKADKTRIDAEHIDFMYKLKDQIDSTRKLIDTWKETKFIEHTRCVHNWSEDGKKCLKCGVYE